MSDKRTSPHSSEFIKQACIAVSENTLSKAKNIINSEYPFAPLQNVERKYTDYEKTKIFIRDGFIDRYSGNKLIFPPVLRVLSKLMPEDFPFQKNWKTSECHIAYWQLLPTIDHITPVSRGGVDIESNWVCTSQLNNSAKSNWLIDELGWVLHPPGNFKKWDGMLGWYMDYIKKNTSILEDKYIKSWHSSAKRALINN